jgi:hypothetical protein
MALSAIAGSTGISLFWHPSSMDVTRPVVRREQLKFGLRALQIQP